MGLPIFREPEAKEVLLPGSKKHGQTEDAVTRARSSIRRSRAAAVNRRPTLTRSPDTAAENPRVSYRINMNVASSERDQAFARLVEDFQASHALHVQESNSTSSGDDTVVPPFHSNGDRPQSRRGPYRRWIVPSTRHSRHAAGTAADWTPRPSLRRVGHRSINSPSTEGAPVTRPVFAEASNHFRSILDPVNASSSANGLGDRERSVSPADSDDPNQWNTMLNSITADPSLPSASSSFASSAAAAANSASFSSSLRGDGNSASRSSRRLPPLGGPTPTQAARERSADCPHLFDYTLGAGELPEALQRDLRQLNVFWETNRLPVEDLEDTHLELLARFEGYFEGFGDGGLAPRNEAHALDAWEQLGLAWYPLTGPQMRSLCILMVEAEEQLGAVNDISSEVELVLDSPSRWLSTDESVEHQMARLGQRLDRAVQGVGE